MKLKNLKMVHSGKVRDIYRISDDQWLIVATDRVSAYDVVLPNTIPGRGVVLTQMSNWWMKRFEHILPNHLLSEDGSFHGSTQEERDWLKGRSVVARRLVPLKVEAIARGFLSGSAWSQYQENGTVNGIELPPGMALSQVLREPIYTPSTKAATGHDENITYEETISRGLLTGGLAPRVKSLTMKLYEEGANHTMSRGLLCADTKFEFGIDPKVPGAVYLMDEVLTPDSSRYWSTLDYRMGENPPSFDKQIIRDYLDEIGWDRVAPAPVLPDVVVAQVSDRYWEALRIITSEF